MTSLGTEVADIHGFLVFSLATFGTANGVNGAVDDISKQSCFEMSHHTIRCAVAHSIGYFTSHRECQ